MGRAKGRRALRDVRSMARAGSDLVLGNLGNDTIYGEIGADTLRGGQNNDVVIGGDGDDWLSGDLGDDTVTGGAGADTFHIFGQAGLDLVTDFNRAEGDRVFVGDGARRIVGGDATTRERDHDQRAGAETQKDAVNPHAFDPSAKVAMKRAPPLRRGSRRIDPPCARHCSIWE